MLPSSMADFVLAHHVLSLAVIDGNAPWSASCFYAFEPADSSVLVMTSVKTRHGSAMQHAPLVCATIAGQPTRIREVRGLQFSATASLLCGGALKTGLERYLMRHPVARLHTTNLWRLSIEEAKLTDNSLVFARKTHWRRDACDAPFTTALLKAT